MMVPGGQNILSHLSVQDLIFLIFSLNDFLSKVLATIFPHAFDESPVNFPTEKITNNK